MAKKKTKMDQKWLIAGLVVIAVAGWMWWKSAGQGLKVAEVAESEPVVQEEIIASWAYDVVEAPAGQPSTGYYLNDGSSSNVVSKNANAWKPNLKTTDLNDKVKRARVLARRSLCFTNRLGTTMQYDPKEEYEFVVKGMISPDGQVIDESLEPSQVGTRKWSIEMLDKRRKPVVTGGTDVEVWGNLPYQALKRRIALKSEIAAEAGTILEIAQIKLCLDVSPKEAVAVDVEGFELAKLVPATDATLE